MKNIFLLTLLLNVVACSSQNQITKVEKIDNRELTRYGAIYMQLIQKNLEGELREKFSGKICKVNIKLVALDNSDAKVKEVKTLMGNAEVCEATIAAVKKVKTFPLPEDKQVREELLDINLTFAPE